MPKLSTYVGQQQQAGQQAAAAAGQLRAAASASPPLASTGLAAAAPPPLAHALQQLQQPQQQQQQNGLDYRAPAAASQQGLKQQHSAADAKLQADYAKRLREYGPRCYRWPDGSLRPDRPPPNPHAVASRRQWAPLVQHCRTHGGDRAYERQGHSLRYGLGVSHQQHEAYLAQIGLQPETDAKGQFYGEVPDLPPPLQDPDHCFNTYYKEGADAVFKDKRGRLL